MKKTADTPSGNLTEELRLAAHGMLELLKRPGAPIEQRLQEADLNTRLKQLEYLCEAVDQLRAMEPDRRYVVVVGETNAGKSSLINRLIGKETRTVHTQRQDTDITVVGHQKFNNEAHRIDTIGRKIRIRSDFVESEFLEDIFIIDTPGSGDLTLDDDMVRMFLLAGDVFVYLISVDKNLHRNDKPAIEYILNELKDAPAFFVVTHASAWLKDDQGEFVEGNIKTRQRDETLGQYRATIRDYIVGGAERDIDFIVCDSRRDYNIETVRAAIENTPINVTENATRKARRIGKIFAEHQAAFVAELDTLQQQYRELFDRTDQTFEEKQDETPVEVRDLKAFSATANTDLTSLLEEFDERAAQAATILTVAEFPLFKPKTLKPDFDLTVKSWAVTYAIRLLQLVSQEATRLLDIARDDLLLELGEGQIRSTKPDDFSKETVVNAAHVDLKLKLREVCLSSRSAFVDAAQGVLDKQKQAVFSIRSQAEQRYIVHRDNSLIAELDRTISELFSRHITNIDMFRASVVVNIGIPLIGAAGLSKEFDPQRLSATALRPMADKHIADIRRTVFGARDQLRASLERARANVIDTHKQGVGDFEGIAARLAAQKGKTVDGDEELNTLKGRAIVSDLIANAVASTEKSLSDEYRALRAEANEGLRAAQGQNSEQSKRVRDGRIRLGLLVVLTAALLVATWSLDWGITGVGAAVATALLAIVAFFYDRVESWRRDGNRITKAAPAPVLAKDGQDMRSKIERWRIDFEAVGSAYRTAIAEACYATIKSEMLQDREVFGAAMSEIQRDVEKVVTNGAKAVNEYAQRWRDLHAGMRQWYVVFADTPTDLQNSAESMKADCVQPFLDMFLAHEAKVKAYRRELNDIRFGAGL